MAPSDPDSDGNTNKPNKSDKPKKKGEDPQVMAASTIARCIDLWCEVDKVIKNMCVLQQDEASKNGDLDEDSAAREVREEYLSKIPAELREYTTRTYYKIIQLLPGLEVIANDPTKSNELKKICNKMNSDIKHTRSSDATRLKSFIPRYCLPNPSDPTSISPPIVQGKGRAEMGLNHPVLARWLCPADQLWRFDANPDRARQELTSGKIPMEGEDFPSFFWSGALPGQDVNSADMLQGLFKSYFLVRVAHHIFLGPSYAVAPPDRKNRSCNAILNNVTTIEAEHIAYVCIQARFGILSMDQWNKRDGDLNYCQMYQSIINFIRNAVDTVWRDSLLQWWNKELFGNENGHGSFEKKTVDKSGNLRMSTMDVLRLQMEVCLAGPPTGESSFSESVLDPSLALLSASNASSGSTGSVGSAVITSSSETTMATPPVPSLPALLVGGAAFAHIVPMARSSAPSLPSTSQSNSESLGPLPSAMPHRQPIQLTMAPKSPLSEDPDASVPLTPTTNRKGKQSKSTKAKGKRAALPTDEVDGGSHGKKAKRTRK